MINESILARPYAIAAFDYALEKADLPGWEAMLGNAAVIARDADMIKLLNDPEINVHDLYVIFRDILEFQLDKSKNNFLRLLAQYKRLAILPAILSLFKSYVDKYNKTMNVKVISAVTLKDDKRLKIAAALAKRFMSQVSIEYIVDPDLIGGCVIRAGDLVIDSSIKNQLKRLLDFI